MAAPPEQDLFNCTVPSNKFLGPAIWLYLECISLHAGSSHPKDGPRAGPRRHEGGAADQAPAEAQAGLPGLYGCGLEVTFRATTAHDRLRARRAHASPHPRPATRIILLRLAAAPFEEPAAPSAPASLRLTPAVRGAVGGGGAAAFDLGRAAACAFLAARCTFLHSPGFPLSTHAAYRFWPRRCCRMVCATPGPVVRPLFFGADLHAATWT